MSTVFGGAHWEAWLSWNRWPCWKVQESERIEGKSTQPLMVSVALNAAKSCGVAGLWEPNRQRVKLCSGAIHIAGLLEGCPEETPAKVRLQILAYTVTIYEKHSNQCSQRVVREV